METEFKPNVIQPEIQKEIEITSEGEVFRVPVGPRVSDIPFDVLTFFGINNPSDLPIQDERQLTQIVRKYADSGSTSLDMLVNFRNIEKKISKPAQGVSRISHIFNYLRVQEQADKLNSLVNDY